MFIEILDRLKGERGPLLPKKKPEKELKKIRDANFEKVKPALENPDEVRMMFGQGGTSNILPALNKEAQKVHKKNWPELDADERNKINQRVRSRIYAEKYLKVDPAKNKNILRQKETEKKIKDFATKFKKENGRTPTLQEIERGTGSRYRETKKYLKPSEYATSEESQKLRVEKARQSPTGQYKVDPLPKEMKSWFKKNYPGKDWEKDFTADTRMLAKNKFKNRNAPTVLSRDEYKKLNDFLQKRKKQGKTLFKGGLEDIAKEAKVNLNPLQVGKYINSEFPNEFTYRGMKIGDSPKIRQRVAELAKDLSDRQIYEQLVKEKLINPSGSKKVTYSNVTNLMKDLQKEGKIKNIIKNPKSGYTPQEEKLRDNLIKQFVDKNPDVDNANAIAKAVNASNAGLKVSSNFVKSSVERQNLGDFIQSRHKKIFSDVKALDKIIKTTPALKTIDKISDGLKEDILSKYAAATGKSLGQAEGELVSRMRKLGHLYAGEKGRYEVELYSKIKPPKNYLDTKFQRNFISLTSKTGAISNISMAKLLGLPKADQELIQGTANMMSAFDFKVAGDHSDIKSMMKDFPNYKKNFSRIEYIKDNLNEFKRTYDIKINNLRKQAQVASGSTQASLLNEANKLQNEFNKITGYRVGSFDINKGRVTINPQTLRLPDLKNPYNETLQQAMQNFETTKNPKLKSIGATQPEKFTGLDKRLINASASERAKIFKDVQGTKAAKESLYLKALQKVPKIGKIATAVIGGTAGAAGMSTLAQAADGTEAGSILPETVAAGTGAAAVGTKKGRQLIGTALKGAGKLLAPVAIPLEAGFMINEMQKGKSAAEVLASPFMLQTAVQGIQDVSRMTPVERQAKARELIESDESGLSSDFYTPDLQGIESVDLEGVQERLNTLRELNRQARIASEAPELIDYYGEGLKEGGPADPSKRKFMKLLAGIASIPFVGKYLKLAEPASKVGIMATEGAKLGVDKLMMLVNKIKKLGTPDKTRQTQDLQEVTVYKGKDGSEYELVEDLATGDVKVTRDKGGIGVSGDRSYDTIEDRSEFMIKKGQADETTKGKKPPDEYEEGKAVFDQDGAVADIDDVDDVTIKAIDDELNIKKGFYKGGLTDTTAPKRGPMSQGIVGAYQNL